MRAHGTRKALGKREGTAYTLSKLDCLYWTR
jgi:hypothetical protein